MLGLLWGEDESFLGSLTVNYGVWLEKTEKDMKIRKWNKDMKKMRHFMYIE